MTSTNQIKKLKKSYIKKLVYRSLKEDLQDKSGNFSDVSSFALKDKASKAIVISREDAVLCGVHFATETFKKIDSSLKLNWLVQEGETVKANQIFLEIAGSIKSILIAERAALNFLQFASAIATKTRTLSNLIKPFGTRVLDTRKTIPTLRALQKYATNIGGAVNHRFGLYDAILLKENHLISAGGIANAISLATEKNKTLFCVVEVENLTQLSEVLIYAKKGIVNRILLDNFSLDEIAKATQLAKGICPLEVSGGISEENIISIAKLGVDFVSIGALTKNIKATDLSLRIIE